MNTKTRTQILIKAPMTFLKALVNEIDEPFIMIEEPHYALVMIKMRDTSQQSLFYSGEVLVTQAKVQLNQYFGLGIIAGMEYDKALLLAKIDAIFKDNHSIIPTWIKRLDEEKKRQDKIASDEIDRLLNTKVEFQTMDKPYDI